MGRKVHIKIKQLQFEDLIIDVEQKNIKHIYLRVYPPAGRVRITAPLGISLDTIRNYAISKLSWIKKQQEKFKDQEKPKQFLQGEIHYYNGKDYLLQIVEGTASPKVELRNNKIVLYIHPNTPREKRQDILNKWYRCQLKMMVPVLIEKWEKKLNVKVNEFRIKKMKTRWGTCNYRAKRVWLSLELAKKSPECLEYVVVHEMVHLLERSHNKIFIAHMDKHLPNWRCYKEGLNRLPGKPKDLGTLS